MRRESFRFIGTMVLLALSSASVLAQAGQEQREPKGKDEERNPVVLRLGNEQIRASEAEAIIEALPPQSRAYYRTMGRRQFAEYIITMRALAAEADKRKLAQEPATARALEICRQSILADAARREIESTLAVTPPEIEQYYREHDKDFEQAHVRHIRIRAASSVVMQPEKSRPAPVPSDEEAEKKLNELRQRVQAGEDFAELARQFSDDLDTAGTGGDAGWISHGNVPLDFAFSLEAGQMSPVFRGPFGFELLKSEGKRTPPLDQIRGRVEQLVRRKKAEDFVQQLRTVLHPVIDEEFFKPIAPQQRPGTTPFQIVPNPPSH